jgi:hypothetical protein
MNPGGSKHVEDNRNQKLNINLENRAFRWFVFYNYIKMHGAKTFLKN